MAASIQNKLECKDLYSYLLTLPTGVLDKMYDHPFTCLAVFRGLPPLSKHYIMRTLFTEKPIPEAYVSTWVKKDSSNKHVGAVSRLKGLRIWKELPGSNNAMRFDMNSTFRKNLRIALCGGGPSHPDTAKYGEDKHARDIPFLEKYTKERWESVLYFMTGSVQTEDGCGVGEEVVRVLINAGLLKFNSEDRSTAITSEGFQFLLMDTATQVWYFLLKYLDSIGSKNTDFIECLSFLFQISFSTLGKDYSVEGLSEMQFKFLQHLREVGLVFQRKKKSRRFYPTSLAINLGSAVTGATTADNQQQGYIIIETNYRIYAYSVSALQIALLSLFCSILCRFPNLCVCILNRESVQQAFATGITADQILHFLRSRAHPQMLNKTPIIPPTISDQIKLWEMERDRLHYTEGVLYNEFLSQGDFETLKKYAEDLGVLLWGNSSKRLMVVSKAGHDNVKRFWKRHKQ